MFALKLIHNVIYDLYIKAVEWLHCGTIVLLFAWGLSKDNFIMVVNCWKKVLYKKNPLESSTKVFFLSFHMYRQQRRKFIGRNIYIRKKLQNSI